MFGYRLLGFGTSAGGFVAPTGGTITTSGGYTIHTFNSSGTFTVFSPITNVEYLVIAGGAGSDGGNS